MTAVEYIELYQSFRPTSRDIKCLQFLCLPGFCSANIFALLLALGSGYHCFGLFVFESAETVLTSLWLSKLPQFYYCYLLTCFF